VNNRVEKINNLVGDLIACFKPSRPLLAYSLFSLQLRSYGWGWTALILALVIAGVTASS
jgi:hypothetical protein